MAWQDFKFTPEDGLENTTTFESKPVSGARARQQFATILNQIKAFLNGTVKNTIDEHKAEIETEPIADKIPRRAASGLLFSKTGATFTDGVVSCNISVSVMTDIGTSLIVDYPIQNLSQSLVFVRMQTGVNTGSVGLYSVSRIGTTITIVELKPMPELVLSVDTNFKVNIANNSSVSNLIKVSIYRLG